jgi:CubicO group peptidase (beta-lactamase class C family)
MPDGRDIEATIVNSSSNPRQDLITYSDLNFLTLQLIIEKITGDVLENVAKSFIFEPLGLLETFYDPPSELKRRIAASEKGNKYEKQTCVELGYIQADDKNPVAIAPGSDGKPPETPDAFRDRQIWGEVHDGNAYFLGGVAGHAGLFSTAAEVFKIAQQFLPNSTRLLKPETTELFRTNFTKGMNEDRSFAFQLASTEDSTAGLKMPPESFGHLGFTGTSLWIDPVNERIFIILTNRTHHHELPFVNINSVRRKFHDLAIDALDQRQKNSN